ncbi:MAG: hypothetical protein JW754_05985 [Candidatus Aenigmarchaeota archaeon]|nr:hypothetical protein [Candidatus Aenigmarchaeota archaeon]
MNSRGKLGLLVGLAFIAVSVILLIGNYAESGLSAFVGFIGVLCLAVTSKDRLKKIRPRRPVKKK